MAPGDLGDGVVPGQFRGGVVPGDEVFGAFLGQCDYDVLPVA